MFSIEQSLQKTYRERIWGPFTKACKQYKLIQEGDRIAVCVSGGKDSFLLAKLMQMLQRYSDVPFEAVYLTMDPGYPQEKRSKVESNAVLLDLPLEIFNCPIFDVVQKAGGSPCYLCARMRRGNLYKAAAARGCNKIALAHHFSDAVETTLISILYGGQVQTMPPRLKSANFPRMELIRPLYLVHEDSIKAWQAYHGLAFINCGCPFTEACVECNAEEPAADKPAESEVFTGEGSKRAEVKRLLRYMKQYNPNVEMSVFRAMENVKLDTALGWTQDGTAHSFLERFGGGLDDS
ncbi:MAG: tRNA 2-thiocytidine biosynthesis TtcA family protein [Oscillospiraceae bacterium]|jgi:tRNA(Ile)-lysidine synthase TilS/MesJ|nr:tRNA 2-thiocytidine biosynthesis TtcA family protein [Oscillospiraceae bacterium]